MLRFNNTIRCQGGRRKILKIKRDDHIGRRCDGGSQHVSVVRIRQREASDPRLVSGDECVGYRALHYGVGPRDLRSQFRRGGQEIALPFIIDVGRPARLKQAGKGELQQQIAQGAQYSTLASSRTTPAVMPRSQRLVLGPDAPVH